MHSYYYRYARRLTSIGNNEERLFPRILVLNQLLLQNRYVLQQTKYCNLKGMCQYIRVKFRNVTQCKNSIKFLF